MDYAEKRILFYAKFFSGECEAINLKNYFSALVSAWKLFHYALSRIKTSRIRR